MATEEVPLRDHFRYLAKEIATLYKTKKQLETLISDYEIRLRSLGNRLEDANFLDTCLNGEKARGVSSEGTERDD